MSDTAQPEAFTVWDHADGGRYLYLCPQEGKDPSTDKWRHGIAYRALSNGTMCWTTKERWDDRFTPALTEGGEPLRMAPLTIQELLGAPTSA